MTIFKVKKKKQEFTQIENSTLRDSSISYEATGMLALMLSLPNDWEIHKTWLVNQKKKCGRDKVNSIMNELIEAGYVVRIQCRDDNGRMDKVQWAVYEESQTREKDSGISGDGNNHDGLAVDGDTANGKPVTTNKDNIQIKNKTNKCLSVKDEFDEERIIPIWNSLGCKKHRMLTSEAAKSLDKTYKAYLADCKEKKKEPSKLNDWLEAYLTMGFTKIMTNHHRDNCDGNWAADLEFAVRFTTYEKVKNHVQ